jgi:DNA-binding winged helix-turn-helix (wHTH) protein/Tfp pilus assembly protein PilF
MTDPRAMPARATIQLADVPDFAVGRVSVRPSRGELARAGCAERVEPRLMQVLVALAQANGATVSRQELIARCWGGLSMSPDAVNRVISLLRQLLARMESGASIETLPRIGYRLDIAAPAASPIREESGAPVALVEDLYRRARVGLEQPSREPIEQALAYLTQAVALAPDFARGWAALAEAQRMLTLYLPAPMQAPARAEARRSAERALALDPALGDAFGTQANLIPRFNRWRDVEALFFKGLAAAPPSAGLLHLHAQFLLAVGYTAKGTEALLQLRERDPLSARVAVELAAALFDLGRTGQALDTISQAHALWPGIMLVWSECVRLHVVADDYRRAQALLDCPPSSVAPDDPNLARRRLHLIARRDRRPGDMAAACKNFLDFARIGIAPATVAIHALTTLDQPEAALGVAEEIFQENPPQAQAPGTNMMATYTLGGQPDSIVLFRRDTASLRGLPRFARILERIGLEAYWRETGSPPDFRIPG